MYIQKYDTLLEVFVSILFFIISFCSFIGIVFIVRPFLNTVKTYE